MGSKNDNGGIIDISVFRDSFLSRGAGILLLQAGFLTGEMVVLKKSGTSIKMYLMDCKYSNFENESFPRMKTWIVHRTTGKA